MIILTSKDNATIPFTGIFARIFNFEVANVDEQSFFMVIVVIIRRRKGRRP